MQQRTWTKLQMNNKKGTTDRDCNALFVSGSVAELSERDRKQIFSQKDVVMIGYAGLAGSVHLAESKADQLLKRYPQVFIESAIAQRELLKKLPEAATAMMSDECALYHLGRAGVFEGLWKMAQLTGVGLEIELPLIPIKQETVEICNFYDINPYELLSEGAMLVMTTNGHRMVHELSRIGISANVIGFTTEGNDRIIINGEEKRYLEKHYQEALFRVEAKNAREYN